MFCFLIDEDIITLCAIWYSNFTKIAICKVNFFESIQLLQDFIVVRFLLVRTHIGTIFGMHDGSPAWGLEIFEGDFGVSGELIDFLKVVWGKLIVEKKACLLDHYIFNRNIAILINLNTICIFIN